MKYYYYLASFLIFFFLQNSQILKFDILLSKQIMTYNVNCTLPPPPTLITPSPGYGPIYL